MPTPILSVLLAANETAHPTLPAQAVWAGVVLIVILFTFLAAAIIGPITRALSPQDMPVTHSPTEPPGHH